MTTPETSAGAGSRLLVQHAADVAERQSRGELRVRQIFQAETAGFESSLSFVLWNRIPAGGANELHVHEDIEKVYYFLAGQGEVACGPWTAASAPATSSSSLPPSRTWCATPAPTICSSWWSRRRRSARRAASTARETADR